MPLGHAFNAYHLSRRTMTTRDADASALVVRTLRTRDAHFAKAEPTKQGKTNNHPDHEKSCRWWDLDDIRTKHEH